MNRELLEKQILFLAINGNFPDLSAEGLKPDHFLDPINQIIFNGIRKIEGQGRCCRLADLGLVLPGEQNVALRLAGLGEEGRTSLEPQYLARELINASDEDTLCRRIASCLRSKQAEGFGHSDVSDKIEQIIREQGKGRIHEKSSQEMLQETIDELLADEEFSSTLKSGITKLDDLIYGFLPGKLYVIAARPGCGKTALATNIALNAMNCDGTFSLYITIELGYKEIQQRLLCATHAINTRDMLKKSFSSDKIKVLEEYRHHTFPISGVNIKADTHGSWESAEDAIKRYVKYDRIGMVVIDYIQQFRIENKKASMRETLAYITSRCKQLAMDLNIPIIAVSQLNRNIESRGEVLPMLSDLKESGTIEQDADVVIMMTRRENEKDVVWFNIAKNRSGETGHFPVKAELQYNRFTDEHVDAVWEKPPAKKEHSEAAKNWLSGAERGLKDD